MVKKKLQNPKELAKKTGIDAFNHFYEFIQQEQIPLKKLYDNYISSNKYQKLIDDDEKQKTEKSWNDFCSLIKKTHLEQITLENSA